MISIMQQLMALRTKALRVTSLLVTCMIAIELHASQPDSTASDSLVLPMPYHGAISVLGTVVPYRSLTRASIASIPYRTLEDAVEWRLPAYILSTGSIGDWNQPLLFGERPRDGRVVADGISAASSATGVFPLAMVMPEFMERFDALVGADAAVLAGSNGGTAYWVQQPWYDVGTLYTRVWYCQSAYDFIATDGVLSQNVAPNVNATLGFRRLTGPGRYDNQWLDAWNTRALLRWNLSPRVNISFVHRFTNWGFGSNGGVNTALSDDPTNERTAIVQYARLNQRLFRHDVQALLTNRLDEHTVLTASLAAVTEEWNIDRSPLLAVFSDSNTQVRWITRTLTANARWERRFDSSLATIVGIESSLDHGTQSDYTAALDRWQLVPFGYMRWNAGAHVSVRGGGRALVQRGQLSPIIGSGLDVDFQGVAVSLDLASSVRMPAQVEGNVLPERTHLAMLRVRGGDSTVAIDASAYVRRRTDAIVASPLVRGDTIVAVTQTNQTTATLETGATLESALRVTNVHIVPVVVFHFVGSQRVPLLYASLSVRYQYRLGRNRLLGELFVRGRTRVRADRYVPQMWSFVPGDGVLPMSYDGITIALAAELGNAVVKLAMGNVISSYYATLSTFPQFDRHITLSVAWTFFD
ncbi:MAG: hypothetical protein N2663_07095 [Chlorobi bacterium]|nr:hypothetical protein [Chlorobiota bacterium]